MKKFWITDQDDGKYLFSLQSLKLNIDVYKTESNVLKARFGDLTDEYISCSYVYGYYERSLIWEDIFERLRRNESERVS